jgi:hypothetical protein
VPAMPSPRPALIALLLLSASAAGSLCAADAKTTTDPQGRIKFNAPQPPEALKNPWPKEAEDAFWARLQRTIAAKKGKSNPRSQGEGEKWGLPDTFMAYVAGDRAEALAAMQTEDIESAEHAHTQGIDFYWCFTLKGQMRKYFGFGDELSPEYRKRMFEGGKAWSATDPRPGLETILLFDSPDPEVRRYAAAEMEKMTGEKHGEDRDAWRTFWKTYADQDWKVFEDYERLKNTRPHPKHGIGKGPVGGAWDPEIRGFVVDARNTDNLRAMREVAVYLMAEETGNELTRKIYKEKLRRTARGFLGVGMGEWDSEGYHGHSFSAWTNLYDFAKDTEVRGYAKAIMDYLSACAAVKYFRGSWGGPSRRDYGNITPFSTSASTFYPYFGGAPVEKTEPDLELAFIMTSGYRPPLALVKFAEKNFDAPVEMLNTHPSYSNWLPGKGDAPEDHETMFFTRQFQLGTLARGNQGDTSGMKLLTANAEGTADYFIGTSAPRAADAKMNLCNVSAGQDRIAQYRNLVIFLNGAKPDAFLHFLMPKGAVITADNGVTFIRAHETWIALTPINAGAPADSGTKAGKSGAPIWSTRGKGGAPFGYALEVGSAATHGDFDTFRKNVAAKSKLDLSGLAQGTVSLRGSTGESVRITLDGDALPKVWRNGEAHDWTKHRAVYSTVGDKAPRIRLGWNERVLEIEAGGHRFRGELKEDGTYVSKTD